MNRVDSRFRSANVIPAAQDLDAERGVLGSVFVVNECFDLIAPKLRAEHFYLRSHRKIFEAI